MFCVHRVFSIVVGVVVDTLFLDFFCVLQYLCVYSLFTWVFKIPFTFYRKGSVLSLTVNSGRTIGAGFSIMFTGLMGLVVGVFSGFGFFIVFIDGIWLFFVLEIESVEGYGSIFFYFLFNMFVRILFIAFQMCKFVFFTFT